MIAPYHDILGNELEFFLLDLVHKTWLGLKRIGNAIKLYFGLFGLLLGFIALAMLLLMTAILWVPLLMLGWYYFKKLTREVPKAAQLAIKDNFQNIDWKTLKTLEYRLQLITAVVKGMQQGMSGSSAVSEKMVTDTSSVLESLAIMSNHIKESYQFKTNTPEIYSAWNQLDDLWDYETPEEDKKMMFGHNKSNRSNDAA